MSSSTTEEGDSVPAGLPGFRFFPSEEILVSYYLKMKIQGKDSKFRNIIPEIEVCKHEPGDLPAFFYEPDVPDHDREWFFFSRPDRKYINSTRCNRATDQGFYKITGKEREIKARRSKAVIGKKRTLTFYVGRMPKATKTDWVMHEYSLATTELSPNPNQQTDFVLCRLKNKSANYKKLKDDSICNELAEPGTFGYISPNSEDDQAAAADYMIPDAVEYLAHKEPERVLLGSHNQDECAESPNGSCLIYNIDIPTFDDNEPRAWNLCFGNQILGEVLDKIFVQPGEVRDSPSPTTQPPLPKDCCSSELQSSSCTNLVNVPGVYNDDCSMRQSTIEDNDFYLPDMYNISTNDHNGAVSKIAHDAHSRATDERNLEACNNSINNDNEPVGNTAYNVQSRATYERTSEAYFELEDLRSFEPFWLQDYALPSPMNTQLGDVGHANKNIGCNDESRSPDI